MIPSPLKRASNTDLTSTLQ